MPGSRQAKIIAQKRVFDDHYKLDLIDIAPPSLRHDGLAAPIQRAILRGRNVSSVLLYDPVNDAVVLNRQFRLAPYLRGDDPFLYECACGGIEAGETPEDAARRETLEETGCTITDLEFIGHSYISAANFDQKVHLFAARVDNAAQGVHGCVDEGEEISTHVVSVARALEMLDAGIITASMAMVSLHWLARNHQRLKDKWLGK